MPLRIAALTFLFLFAACGRAVPPWGHTVLTYLPHPEHERVNYFIHLSKDGESFAAQDVGKKTEVSLKELGMTAGRYFIKVSARAAGKDGRTQEAWGVDEEGNIVVLTVFI